ncbi:MAG TPA: ATP-binding protein, partial [Acidimicrobiales bacterium]|nr:ATP-binding protein [Acidimicrobiales bacterium]
MGRAVEVSSLDRWLEEARQGTPRFIVLSGEPGMGTTRLADEVQARARQAGMRVLAGRCFEDVAVPYLPMVTALRPLIASDSAPALEPLLGRGALSAAGEPNDLALYIGVSETLLDASKDTPFLLALDALQWADRATLDLLAHVVGAIAQAASDGGVPACVLLTVSDLDADAPAHRTLRRIAREPGARALELRGLDAVE